MNRIRVEEAVFPSKCLCIHALDGYETYKIDDSTIGVRPIWFNVKDRLPANDDDYLTYVMDNGCSYRIEVQRFYKNPRILKGIYADSSTHWEKTTWDDNIVTHWMPLPETPDETI